MYDNALFVNFSLGERTQKISEYSAKKCGFKNYIDLDHNINFYEKMRLFFKICYENKNNYKVFVRSDADRIILPGIKILMDSYENYHKKPWFLQGTGIEYIMNLNKRNATPNIYSKDCIEFFHENFDKVVSDNTKPESSIASYIKNKKGHEYFVSIATKPTNIHEFEQHPEKIVNAFLNRLWRGHGSYYKKDYLQSLPKEYQAAIEIALKLYNRNKKNNNFKYVKTEDIILIDPKFKLKISPILDNADLYQMYVNKFKNY